MTLESMYKDDAALRIFQSAFEVDRMGGALIESLSQGHCKSDFRLTLLGVFHNQRGP